jgi:YD repeat-containing protein
MSAFNEKIVDVETAPPVSQGTSPWVVSGVATTTPINLALRAEYDGNSLLIYFADAVPGSVDSAAVWRIRKLTYDGNGNFTAMTWPSGSTDSTFIWDDRAGYTYS